MSFFSAGFLVSYIVIQTWRDTADFGSNNAWQEVDIGGGQMEQTCSLFPLPEHHLPFPIRTD